MVTWFHRKNHGKRAFSPWYAGAIPHYTPASELFCPILTIDGSDILILRLLAPHEVVAMILLAEAS